MSRPTTPNASETRAIIDLLARSRQLKLTKRAGWVQRDVKRPETVAEHSFRVALMALLVAPQSDEGVDADRCVRMALVHDLAECVVGDITPNDGVSDEDKHAMEAKAMGELCALAGEKAGADVEALWREYEAGETAEARLVKDMDKLEMILQAQEYESEGDAGVNGNLEEFFASTRGRFKTATGERWSAEIEARRPSTTTTTKTTSD